MKLPRQEVGTSVMQAWSLGIRLLVGQGYPRLGTAAEAESGGPGQLRAWLPLPAGPWL